MVIIFLKKFDFYGVGYFDFIYWVMFSDRVFLIKNSSKIGYYMGKFIVDWGGSL